MTRVLRRAGLHEALPLFLVCLLPGCGDAAGGTAANATLVRDSAGIQIVENTRGAGWEDGEGWRLSPQALLEIGMAEGNAAYLLDRVVGARRLGNGVVVVANAGSGELRFFGSDGRHLQTAGRRGDGPGEYRNIALLDDYRGDSLFVYDANARRASVLYSDGVFGRAVTFSNVGEGGFPTPVATFADGTLMGRMSVLVRAEEITSGMQKSNASYGRFSGVDGTLLDSLATLPGRESHLLLEEQRIMITSPLLARDTYVGVDGDKAYLGYSGTFELSVYGTDGTLERLIRRSGSPIPVTTEEVARLTEERLEGIDDDNHRTEMSKVLSTMPAPEFRPAFAGLMTDDARNLWVRETVLPGEPQVWTVFDPQGVLLGPVSLPDDFRPLQIGADFVLGVASDDLGVQRVRMYALEKP